MSGLPQWSRRAGSCLRLLRRSARRCFRDSRSAPSDVAFGRAQPFRSRTLHHLADEPTGDVGKPDVEFLWQQLPELLIVEALHASEPGQILGEPVQELLNLFIVRGLWCCGLSWGGRAALGTQ